MKFIQALMYTDLRERTYVMMNDEKVVIRRRGRCELFIYLFARCLQPNKWVTNTTIV